MPQRETSAAVADKPASRETRAWACVESRTLINICLRSLRDRSSDRRVFHTRPRDASCNFLNPAKYLFFIALLFAREENT